MAFFEIVSTMFSVLFYAILATMVLMGMLFVLLRAIDKRHVGTIPFFITGVFLAVFLVVQLTLMFGAMRASEVVSDLKDTVTTFSNVQQNGLAMLADKLSDGASINLEEEASKMKDNIGILKAYGGILDLKAEDFVKAAKGEGSISDNIFQMVDDRLSTYVWHRVWWIIGISILSCIIVLMLPGKKSSYGGGKYSCDYSSSGSSSSDVGDWGF